MYGNPTFDCDGADIRAHCRQLATVVTIKGHLDDSNVDCASRYTRRFILAEKPFVLDLSDIASFTREAISLLFTVDDVCTAAGVEWSTGRQPLRRAGSARMRHRVHRIRFGSRSAQPLRRRDGRPTPTAPTSHQDRVKDHCVN